MTDETFPRFQYSIIDKNGHDAQWVVRGNEWEQFLLDVQAVTAKVEEHEEKADPIQYVTKNVNTHPCKTCGEWLNLNPALQKAEKNGKVISVKQIRST